MKTNKNQILIKIKKDDYDFSNPNKERLVNVKIVHVPTGINVIVRDKEQNVALNNAMKEIQYILDNKVN